jgi:predicted secreted protein
MYQAGQMPPVPVQIPNYMVQAVLVTLLCCLPIGIVGIFKANGINKKIAAGDIAGALADSKSNKTLLLVGCIAGLVISVLYVMAKMHS